MICLIAMTVLTLGTLVLAQETDYFVHALGVLAVIWIIVGLLAAHSLGGKVKRPILVETPYPQPGGASESDHVFFGHWHHRRIPSGIRVVPETARRTDSEREHRHQERWTGCIPVNKRRSKRKTKRGASNFSSHRSPGLHSRMETRR